MFVQSHFRGARHHSTSLTGPAASAVSITGAGRASSHHSRLHDHAGFSLISSLNCNSNNNHHHHHHSDRLNNRQRQYTLPSPLPGRRGNSGSGCSGGCGQHAAGDRDRGQSNLNDAAKGSDSTALAAAAAREKAQTNSQWPLASASQKGPLGCSGGCGNSRLEPQYLQVKDPFLWSKSRSSSSLSSGVETESGSYKLDDDPDEQSRNANYHQRPSTRQRVARHQSSGVHNSVRLPEAAETLSAVDKEESRTPERDDKLTASRQVSHLFGVAAAGQNAVRQIGALLLGSASGLWRSIWDRRQTTFEENTKSEQNKHQQHRPRQRQKIAAAWLDKLIASATFKGSQQGIEFITAFWLNFTRYQWETCRLLLGTEQPITFAKKQPTSPQLLPVTKVGSRRQMAPPPAPMNEPSGCHQPEMETATERSNQHHHHNYGHNHHYHQRRHHDQPPPPQSVGELPGRRYSRRLADDFAEAITRSDLSETKSAPYERSWNTSPRLMGATNYSLRHTASAYHRDLGQPRGGGGGGRHHAPLAVAGQWSAPLPSSYSHSPSGASIDRASPLSSTPDSYGRVQLAALRQQDDDFQLRRRAATRSDQFSYINRCYLRHTIDGSPIRRSGVRYNGTLSGGHRHHQLHSGEGGRWQSSNVHFNRREAEEVEVGAQPSAVSSPTLLDELRQAEMRINMGVGGCIDLIGTLRSGEACPLVMATETATATATKGQPQTTLGQESQSFPIGREQQGWQMGGANYGELAADSPDWVAESHGREPVEGRYRTTTSTGSEYNEPAQLGGGPHHEEDLCETWPLSGVPLLDHQLVLVQPVTLDACSSSSSSTSIATGIANLRATTAASGSSQMMANVTAAVPVAVPVAAAANLVGTREPKLRIGSDSELYLAASGRSNVAATAADGHSERPSHRLGALGQKLHYAHTERPAWASLKSTSGGGPKLARTKKGASRSSESSTSPRPIQERQPSREGLSSHNDAHQKHHHHHQHHHHHRHEEHPHHHQLDNNTHNAQQATGGCGPTVDAKDQQPLESTAGNSSSGEQQQQRAKKKLQAAHSLGKVSLAGAKRRLGFKQKGLNSLSVHRSEEVLPFEVLNHAHLLTHQTHLHYNLFSRSQFSTSTVSATDSLEADESCDDESLAWQSRFRAPDPKVCFVDGLGLGQIASRQALVSPYLGDVQLSLSDHRGMLEVEVIRVRQLQPKPTAKRLPSPYVKVYLMRNRKCVAKFKTNQAKHTLDPLYQQLFKFRDDYSRCVLQVIVWADYGKKDRKSLMGIVQIHLDDLDISSTLVGWYKLFNAPSMANPSLMMCSSKALRQTLSTSKLAESHEATSRPQPPPQPPPAAPTTTAGGPVSAPSLDYCNR